MIFITHVTSHVFSICTYKIRQIQTRQLSDSQAYFFNTSVTNVYFLSIFGFYLIFNTKKYSIIQIYFIHVSKIHLNCINLCKGIKGNVHHVFVKGNNFIFWGYSENHACIIFVYILQLTTIFLVTSIRAVWMTITMPPLRNTVTGGTEKLIRAGH